MAARELENRITGDVALVTGASDGIGRACAQALRSRGFRLALSGRSEEKLTRVAGPDDLILPADLTSPDAPGALIDATVARFGRLDTLINNAGHGIYWPVADSPAFQTRAMFDLNFFAPLALAQAAIPVMRRQRAGTIVNVGSIAGNVALPWMPLYSASKSALAAITVCLRGEVAADGIHVMLVTPGYVLTDFHAHSHGLQPPPKVVDSKRFAITPERCARDILRGMESRADTVVTPRSSWVLMGMHALAPRAVETYLLKMNAPDLERT